MRHQSKAAAAKGKAQKGPVTPAQKLIQALGEVHAQPRAAPSRGCAVISEDLLRHLRDELGEAKVAVPQSQTVPSGPRPMPIKSTLNVNQAAGPRVRPELRDMAVGTEPIDDEATAPGRRHAGISTDDEGPSRPMPTLLQSPAISPQAVLVNSPRKALFGDLGSPRGPVLPAIPQPDSPHGYGRCDLFTVDRQTAERDRERKRLQAQMLSDQIEEQRKRKAEEKRRLQAEEMEEERRLERERRELQELQRPRAEEMQQSIQEMQRPMQEHSPSPAARSRRKQQEQAPEHQSSPGHWEDSPSVPTRRRRKVKKTTASSTATWQTGEKRTWRDKAENFAMNTDHQPTSHSPNPWMATAEQVDHPHGLNTVRESSHEFDKSEARSQRRSRPRGQQREETWDDDDDDHHQHRLRTGGRRPRAEREKASVLPSPERTRMASKLTEDELREQLSSLMRVCEHLLRERAERDGALAANPMRTPRRVRDTRSSAGRDSPSAGGDRRPPQAQGPSARGDPLVSARSYRSHASRTSNSGPEEWGPGDALAELLASSELEMPEDDLPIPLAEAQHRHGRPAPLGEFDPSPFALPGARGMALRRSPPPQSPWSQQYGPAMGSVWSPSPVPMSRGGLNLQANWPGFPGPGPAGPAGRSYDLQNGNDSLVPPLQPNRLGPGQVPIGIKPSIQAQSAMLRELYPRVL